MNRIKEAHMPAWFKRLYEGPNFPGDEEKTNLGRIMNTLGLYYFLALLFFAVLFVPLFARYKLENWAILMTLISMYAISRSVMQRGRLTLAGSLMLVPAWIVFVFVAIISGGVFSPLMYAVAAVTIVTGLLLDRRIGMGFLAASILTGLGLAILQQMGGDVPHYFIISPIVTWFLFILSMLFTHNLVRLIVNKLQSALELAQNQGDTLRQTEASLQQSEEKYRNLVENISDIIFSVDAAGQVGFISPQIRAFGYEPKDIMGRSYVEFIKKFIHSDDFQRVSGIFDAASIDAGEEPPPTVFKACTQEGKTKWLEQISTLQREPTGKVSGLYGIMRDVTLHQEAERTTRIISEVQYALLQPCEVVDIYALISEKVHELVGDCITGIGILDETAQTVTGANYQGINIQTIEKVFTTFGSNLMAKAMPIANMSENELRIYRSGRLERLEEGLFTILSSMVPKTICSIVEQILRVSELFAIGIVQGNQHLGALVILARVDITPYKQSIEQIINLASFAIYRKRAEQALQKSERRLQALITNGVEYISLLDARGNLVWESPSSTNLLAYSENEFIGKSIFAIMHPDDIEETSRQFAEIVKQPGGSQAGTFRMRRSDGTWRWLEAIATNLLDDPAVGAVVINYHDISDRKHATDELHRSEAHLRGVLLNSPDTVYTINLSNHQTTLLGRENFCGYSQNELQMPGSIMSAIHPDDSQMVVNYWQQTTSGTITSKPIEYRMMSKNGSQEWIEQRVAVLSDNPDGSLDELIVILRIVTERRRAEQALRESEEYNKLLFISSRTPIVVMDAETHRYIDCNPAAVKIYYFGSREETLGKTPLDVSAEVQYDGTPSSIKVQQVIEECIQSGSVFFEWRHQRPNGEIWDAEVNLMSFKAHGRDLMQFSLQDITERKLAEKTLLERDMQFRAITDTSPDALLVSRTSDGRILYANEQLGKMINIGTSDLINRQTPDFYAHPTDRQSFLEKLKLGLVNNWEVLLKRKAGETFWAMVSARLGTFEGQDVIYAGLRDITDRKQAEGKILAALEEKETLLREIHHRVKNNLQVIIALINMRFWQTSDDEVRQFLKELEGQAHTMSLVYEQLYQSENLSQVVMESYLRQLTTNVFDTFGHRNAIQVNIDTAISLDVSQAMPCGLIVNELFTNILKHAFPPSFHGQPCVTITLRQEDENFHLTVADNGVGLKSGIDFHSTQSMGLHLVNLWATHQLGGLINVSSKNGTTIAISFERNG